MESVGEFEYSPKDLIGHGAFAVVFKGRHAVQVENIVAIKSITKKNLAKSQNLLEKEIKILKELTELKHENVVALLDCKETANNVFLVMEYCNGGDLADYLHSMGTLSEDTIRLFLKQIAGAMRALNAKGVVHRDLKPQNILLCYNNQSSADPFITSGSKSIITPRVPPSDITLKIADFGFARFLNDGVMAATLCGSPMYMAPEVIMSLQYDAKADLWSIGTIVFQCLTGKAPFQAQTPQQLKQYYERNPNLAPKIPNGTSKELTDLLLKLLTRNAKNRIGFEEFFEHPFMTCCKKETSRPVAVPKSSPSSPISCSPSIQSPVSYGSPAVHDVRMSPLHQRHGEKVRTAGLKGSPHSGDSSSPDHEVEGGFVVIDRSAKIPETKPGMVTPSKSSRVRPEPVPVPGRRMDYDRIQKSMNKVSMDKVSMDKVSMEVDEKKDSRGERGDNREERGCRSSHNSESGSSVGSEGSGSRFDVAQFTPPDIKFFIGTPPGISGASGRSFGSNSSLDRFARRQSVPANFNTRNISPNICSGQQIQPPQTASTCKAVTPVRSFETMPLDPQLRHQDNLATFPPQDNLATFAPWIIQNHPGQNAQLGKRNSLGSFSGLQRAITYTEGHGFPPQHSGQVHSGQVHSGQCHSGQCHSGQVHTGQVHSGQCHSGQGGCHYHQPQVTSCCCGHRPSTSPSRPISVPFASPPHMEESAMTFVPPELPAETILDKEHNETLAKLNFVLALVECIMDLAEKRENPLTLLTESTCRKLPSEWQRKGEQLVLYLRCLQLISSALQLAKQEISASRLKTSSSVRSVLKCLKERFHECLDLCKSLDAYNLSNKSSNEKRDLDSINADRIIYKYAIEMCQSAALEELFGQPDECFRRYQTAQILLHSLSQQVSDSSDRKLLNMYKDAVEKRLFVLQGQGYIYAFDSSQNE